MSDVNHETSATNPFGFKLFSAGHLLENAKPTEWLVKPFIEYQSIGDYVSETGIGKTHLALDVGCHIAAGIDWHGHPVKQGPVILIAGEGNRGLAKRLMAIGIHHGIDMSKIPFFLSDRAAQLSDIESIFEVETALWKIVGDSENLPVLVIIDTLACNFGPGNESSVQDMNVFLWNVKMYIQERFKTTVLIIHHTGHGNKDRGRGASNFPAAMDFHFMLERKSQNVIQLTNVKQKDAELAPPVSFELNVIELPLLDDEGVPLTSIALSQTDTLELHDAKGLGKNQQNALDLLKLMCEERLSDENAPDCRVTIKDWKERAEQASIVYGPYARQNFQKIKSSLDKRGLITIDGVYVNVL